MGDRLRAGIPSRYVTSQLGQVICGLQSQLFSENERLFKVTPYKGSHVHRKCGSIEEIVQDTHVVTTHQ